MITALLAYVAFHVATAFFAPSSLPSGLHEPVLGIAFNSTRLVGTSNLLAINTGFVGSIIILSIVRFMVNHIQKRSPYSIFSFVDKSVSNLFTSVVLI